MTEPDRNNFPNLLHKLKQYVNEKSGLKEPYLQHLHRLDRPVSGVVLFTKKKEFLRNLSEQFAQRKVQKYYIALTGKAPGLKKSILEQWHRKEKKKGIIVDEGTPFAEKVKLEYTIEPAGKYFLWHIQLHTGKFHQVRAQLASLGCSILGDKLYGSEMTYKPDAIALHAERLIIQHPLNGNQIEFIAPKKFFD